MNSSENFSLYVAGADRLELAVEKPYSNEAELQDTLGDLPQLLETAASDGTGVDDLVLLASEVGIPGEMYGPDVWSLDLLFVDRDRILTLVEVKLERNAEIRRKVVGQIIDYAAHAALHWSPQFIRDLVQGADEAVLGIDDIDEFVKDVHANLRAGNMRLMVASDRMPAGLERMIEFLDDQSREMEIRGVAIPRYEIDGRTVYAPSATREATGRSARGPRREVPIDEQAASSAEVVDLLCRIEETADAEVRDTAMSRSWTMDNGVRIQVTPDWNKMFFDVGSVLPSARDEFRRRLAAIAGPDRLLKEWYPSIPADLAIELWDDIDGLLRWLALLAPADVETT